MAETYPVFIDGSESGRLTVTRDGLHTIFEARCSDPGRIVRLSVYGDEKEGYLGVMLPKMGELHLRKSFSKGALKEFPERFEHAGEAGVAAGQPKNSAPLAAESRPVMQKETPMSEKERQPMPESTSDTEELLWYRAGDGSLYTVYQGRRFRAIPATTHGLPEQHLLERRVIEGVEYAVFETKNGKII